MTNYVPLCISIGAFLVAIALNIYLQNWHRTYISVEGVLSGVYGKDTTGTGVVYYNYNGESFSAGIALKNYTSVDGLPLGNGSHLNLIISPTKPDRPYPNHIPTVVSKTPLFIFIGTLFLCIQIVIVFSSLKGVDTSIEDDLIIYSSILEGMKKHGGATNIADYNILDEVKLFISKLKSRDDIALSPSQSVLYAELANLLSSIKSNI